MVDVLESVLANWCFEMCLAAVLHMMMMKMIGEQTDD